MPVCCAANYYNKLVTTNVTAQHIVMGTSHNFKIQNDTKKRELFKNPTKIEEIQERKKNY